jgi:hypothetical protein
MPRKRTTDPSERALTLEELALFIVHDFIRNTCLEDLHAGKSPRSETGDYSDVNVVTPFGEIPWKEVSRLSDEEMKAFMIECVDNIYTFLKHQEKAVLISLPKWNRPKLNRKMLKAWKFWSSLSSSSKVPLRTRRKKTASPRGSAKV